MHILAISGSLRAASCNTMLLHEALRLFGNCSHEFADLNLPLFNEELEVGGLPEPVLRLVAQIRAADAVIFATPEYNKMIPGVLKNALDWVSRDTPKPLAGKPVALVSTAGRSGGEVSQFTMRHALTTFDANVMQGSAFVVPNGATAFDGTGQLTDAHQQKSLAALMKRLRAISGSQQP